MVRVMVRNSLKNRWFNKISPLLHKKKLGQFDNRSLAMQTIKIINQKTWKKSLRKLFISIEWVSDGYNLIREAEHLKIKPSDIGGGGKMLDYKLYCPSKHWKKHLFFYLFCFSTLDLLVRISGVQTLNLNIFKD